MISRVPTVSWLLWSWIALVNVLFASGVIFPNFNNGSDKLRVFSESLYPREYEACFKSFRELPTTYGDGINLCMKLNGGILASKELHFSPENDLTFEFDIKLDIREDSCVDVFSYEVENTRTLRLQACADVQQKIATLQLKLLSTRNGAVKTNSTLPLKVTVQLSTWYHMALVWRRTDSVLEVTALNSDGEVRFSSYVIKDANFIGAGGFVTLGNSQSPYSPMARSGSIWIDEIKISERAFSADELRENIHSNNSHTEKDLISLLRLPEGAGIAVDDEISNNSLHVITNSGRIPSWTVCSQESLESQVARAFYNLTNLESAEAICEDIIYHDAMVSKCSRHLPLSVPQQFYIKCVNDVMGVDDATRAIDSLTSYARYCEMSLCLTLWPAYPVCNDLTKNTAPSRCYQEPERPCYAGRIGNNGACQCDHGWYGDFCSMRCPGGPGNACGGVGECKQRTGSCLCPVNFNQTTDCTTCASGFIGKHCTSYFADPPNDSALVTASAYGYGRYLTLQGVVFSLPLPGEFVFFQSEEVGVYVRQMPATDIYGLLRFYIGQIWIRTKTDSITISPNVLSIGSDANHQSGTVLMNGKTVELKKGKEHGVSLDEKRLLWKISRDWFELELSGSSSRTARKKCNYIRVNVKDGMLNLYITCESSFKNNKMENERGLLPPVSQLSLVKVADFQNLTLEKLIRDIAKLTRVPINMSSHFIYDLPDGLTFPKTMTYAGNCLRFEFSDNASSRVSANLKGSVSLDSGLSLEMYIQVKSEGVFFTYQSGSNDVAGFSLSFSSGNLKIGINGGNWINTGIQLSHEVISHWGMLTLNCDRNDGNVWLYYATVGGAIHSSEVMTREKLQILTPIGKKLGGSVWFDPSGSVVLGGGILKESATPVKTFSGAIDEVRMWDRTLTKFQTLQNFGLKFLGEDFYDDLRSWEPRLTAVWNFDEGHGEVSRNLISGGNDMRIVTGEALSATSQPERVVFWAPSDAPVSPRFKKSPTDFCKCMSTIEPPFVVIIKRETIWAEDACREAIIPVTKNSVCRSMLRGREDIISMQCMEDVLRQNSTGQAKLLADVYAGICRFTLNLTDPCMPNPCQHNSICETMDATDYKCNCPCGYTGKNCETDIDECRNQPCVNGGICRDDICAFRCDCPRGYVGKLCQRKCINPLGLESGAFSDTQMSASSEYQGGMPWYLSYLARRGRLNKQGWGGGWVPKVDDDNPWLQLSFSEPMRVTGMALQGVKWNGYDSWTTTFAISSSDDCVSWRRYGEELHGNNASVNAVVNMFTPPITGQYFRVNPLAFHIRPAIRMELYGCSACDCCQELGMESFHIRDFQISASSTHGADCERCSSETAAWPRFGRLDGPRNQYADFNLWMAKENDAHPWIMADLLTPHNVNGVIVQGGHFYRYSIYTTAFTVSYSMDNEKWTKLPKIFEGNHDSKNHRKVVFEEPIQGRFIKLDLQDWRTHPGMRFELLGCSIGEYI